MTTWLISSLIVFVAAVVLAVVFWPRHPSDGNGGRVELERARRQQEKVQPLIRDLRARRGTDNFAELFEQAMQRGS